MSLTIWTPLDTSGGLVDSQHNELRLPALTIEAPHIRILVSATCDNPIRVWSPINAQHL